MSFNATTHFSPETLDLYLKALAKEFRKQNGTTTPAELILVGGAAILTNYGFRNMTTDIDAIILASSAMKEAINYVGDKYHLPNGWLNADFTRTPSYSPKLIEFSTYYRTFSNILIVRTISAEYLIAMKLRSGRKYKNDLSDIVGILAEHKQRGAPISLNAIHTAIINLYGSLDTISPDSHKFIEDIINQGDFQKIYALISQEEKLSKDILIHFQETYPHAVTTSNADNILKTLRERKSN